MTTFMLVSLLLALFAGIIIIIIGGNNLMKAKNLNADCERNDGLCVEVENCATCTTLGDCRQKYVMNCPEPKPDESIKICCPRNDVLHYEGEKT